MELTIKEILQLGGDLTVIGTLITAVYLFMTGKIIPRAVYEEMVQQNQELTKGFMRELADNVTCSVVDALHDILGKKKGDT